MPDRTNKISFLNALYLVSAADLKFIRENRGVYIFWEGDRLYCGKSQNLWTRILASIYVRKFGKTVLFFSEELLQTPEGYPVENMINNLEIDCIGALHTIIWGNGLPLELQNKNHVKILPFSAWNVNSTLECKLAIQIAQTVLYTMGFPRCMTELPFYLGLDHGLPAIIAAENANRWVQIFETERIARQKGNHPGCPMILIDPA